MARKAVPTIQQQDTMYRYTDFDRQFVQLRAEQFRDQLERWQRGELSDEQFLPLRLQNGWYVQRYAPMLRIAVPYGEISSAQLRVLARLAREFDQPEPALLREAQRTQDALQASQPGLTLAAPPLKHGYGHFTTRTNVQFNWIPLARAADAMDLLASVGMHGIQTSGNAIRNITCEALAGIAPDEIVDTRPFAEILRQWSTLHPEFAFLPRKFKIAFNGAAEDRAATGWYDIGLQALRNDAGEVGFTVKVGGGMGRTPVIGSVVREFLPWDQLLNYVEAVIRAYNLYGRRDNKYKARIKILVKAEGQKFIDAVEAEYRAILEQDGAPHTITRAELERVQAGFEVPPLRAAGVASETSISAKPFQRWLAQNVRQHRLPELSIVTLSFKRPGWAPGDADAATLDALAGSEPVDDILRQFEFTLLGELGYGFSLDVDGLSGAAVLPDHWYHYHPDWGLVARGAGTDPTQPAFAGAELLAMAAGGFGGQARGTAKRLLRQVLAVHLGEAPLRSRELFRTRSSGERTAAAGGDQA